MYSYVVHTSQIKSLLNFFNFYYY